MRCCRDVYEKYHRLFFSPTIIGSECGCAMRRGCSWDPYPSQVQAVRKRRSIYSKSDTEYIRSIIDNSLGTSRLDISRMLTRLLASVWIRHIYWATKKTGHESTLIVASWPGLSKEDASKRAWTDESVTIEQLIWPWYPVKSRYHIRKRFDPPILFAEFA